MMRKGRFVQLDVSRSAIRSALDAEVAHERRWLPDDPAIVAAEESPDQFVDLVQSQLRKGFLVGRRHEVFARKPGFGLRPLSIVGLVERVLMRLLTDMLLADVTVDRSRAAYSAFRLAPILAALEAKGRNLDTATFVRESFPHLYVVKADIGSFYDFIDHRHLLEELLVWSDDISHAQLLTQVVSEIMGAQHGLPQFTSASDILSEAYAMRIMRPLCRVGIVASRFNDDFLLLAHSFPEALFALEELDRHSRAVGLSLNDRKTTIIKLDKYFRSAYNIPADDELPAEIDNDAAADAGDYEAIGGPMDIDDAVRTLQSVTSELRTGEDLRDVTITRAQEVGKAIQVLGEADLARLGRWATLLQRFFPIHTPRICRALVSGDTPTSLFILSEILEGATLNSWQEMWYAWVLTRHRASALAMERRQRVEWLRERLSPGKDVAVAAIAAAALALDRQLDLSTLEGLFLSLPSGVQPYAFLAARHLGAYEPKAERWMHAIEQTHPLSRLISV